jgi:hypothetical protein
MDSGKLSSIVKNGKGSSGTTPHINLVRLLPKEGHRRNEGILVMGQCSAKSGVVKLPFAADCLRRGAV